MSLKKKISLATVAVISLSLLIISATLGRTQPAEAPAYGIEIPLKKTFYVPASTSNKEISIVVRVPSAGTVDANETVSAVRLVPRMQGDKVQVTVFALSGDAGNFKTCKEWDSLKSVKVGVYTAGLDDEVAIAKLSDYGVRFGNEPLKFRVVPRRGPPQVGYAGFGGDCGCATCGRLECCPNSGSCLGCGDCGEVCCRP
jgi:hypothetical protein